ncbi:hypothetical protein McpCs1_06170 [Methanocorpusculaceae archaeon Cs1]|uniref:Uncharacterized protein n=1 Tax=Methanorbis rubei TaxID=3028300 RepID=A0AAE4MGW1_9EURY|nr:hypothetical protein [Methanocorpusculaceae archaeon Cs1]
MHSSGNVMFTGFLMRLFFCIFSLCAIFSHSSYVGDIMKHFRSFFSNRTYVVRNSIRKRDSLSLILFGATTEHTEHTEFHGKIPNNETHHRVTPIKKNSSLFFCGSTLFRVRTSVYVVNTSNNSCRKYSIFSTDANTSVYAVNTSDNSCRKFSISSTGRYGW